jgi:hypothetical protein
MSATGDSGIAGFALDGHDWDGLYLARRKGQDVVYAGQGRSWFRQGVRRRSAQTAQTADPQDPALYEEDRPQGHLEERLFLGAAIRKVESEVATGGRENKKSSLSQEDGSNATPAEGVSDGDWHTTPVGRESDPLAELARLIGQNDPFAGAFRPPRQNNVPYDISEEKYYGGDQYIRCTAPRPPRSMHPQIMWLSIKRHMTTPFFPPSKANPNCHYHQFRHFPNRMKKSDCVSSIAPRTA